MIELVVLVAMALIWVGIAYGVGFWIGHFWKKRKLKVHKQ